MGGMEKALYDGIPQTDNQIYLALMHLEARPSYHQLRHQRMTHIVGRSHIATTCHAFFCAFFSTISKSPLMNIICKDILFLKAYFVYSSVTKIPEGKGVNV